MTKLPVLALLCSSLLLPLAAHAGDGCDGLPNWQQFKQALANACKDANGGFNLDMWGTVVATDGTVCAVAHTGAKVGDQWLGSRVISAQKANTANAFSLQFSNPVDTQVAYVGSAADFGTVKDPLVGARIGGVNVFGGCLALYDAKGTRVGALGVSGDSSCADHNIAWKTRHALALDYVPAGVSPAKDDNIVYLDKTEQANGFKHPMCGGTEDKVTLPPVRKR